MKQLLITLAVCLVLKSATSQTKIEDKAMFYQQERMVYKQWDKAKFEPTSGLLGINPYYWLTWGLHPNYPDTDRRPLVPWGPQSQRLGLVGMMNGVSNGYKLEADTLRNTALAEVTNYSGALSSADLLWILYYSKELKPVLEYSEAGILNALPAVVRAKVISEGTYSWYKNELDILKERINGARSANMDRSSRILAYHRLLQEYRTLASTWATRTANSGKNLNLSQQQQKVKNAEVNIGAWTSGSDVEIAKQVTQNRKY